MSETVQKSNIRRSYPLIKGDLGGWVFRQRNLARVSCTVSRRESRE